jgi:hypothetical protein
MLRFIVDTQLPPLLATYLKSKGNDAIHTTYFKDGHLLQDSEILRTQILLPILRLRWKKLSTYFNKKATSSF